MICPKGEGGAWQGPPRPGALLLDHELVWERDSKNVHRGVSKMHGKQHSAIDWRMLGRLGLALSVDLLL